MVVTRKKARQRRLECAATSVYLDVLILVVLVFPRGLDSSDSSGLHVGRIRFVYAVSGHSS